MGVVKRLIKLMHSDVNKVLSVIRGNVNATIHIVNKNKQESKMDTCEKCGAEEVPTLHPRTQYECGSSDYDKRLGTFSQSEECKNRVLYVQHTRDKHQINPWEEDNNVPEILNLCPISTTDDSFNKFKKHCESKLVMENHKCVFATVNDLAQWLIQNNDAVLELYGLD